MSGEILQTIIDDGHIKDDALDDIDMKRVQQLIVGSCENHQPTSNGALPLNDKRFLFDIVANGRNSIDVDKFDYLARDSHYCNVKVSCDLNRLQRLTKVLQALPAYNSFSASQQIDSIFRVIHYKHSMQCLLSCSLAAIWDNPGATITEHVHLFCYLPCVM